MIDLREADVVPESAGDSIDQFLKEFEALKARVNPDRHYAFDD